MKRTINNRINLRESDKPIPAAGAVFERGFMSHSLEQQISHCARYELVEYFCKWLPKHQPILEAGCGSGRWVAWFVKNGWDAVGIDWSESCCIRARQAIPDARFEAGDMRQMPFGEAEFGSIVSLGAVEHSAEGPARSLSEYRRVLRPGGIAIITVPYLGPVRRMHRLFTSPKKAIVHNPLLRRVLGKPGKGAGQTVGEARRETLSGYAADFIVTECGWEFYQYHFSKSQMRGFIKEAGLEIIEEFVDFGDEGVLHNFGRVAGEFDYDKGMVSFSVIGKALRRMLPVGLAGHMLCYLVRKKY